MAIVPRPPVQPKLPAFAIPADQTDKPGDLAGFDMASKHLGHLRKANSIEWALHIC